MGSRLRVNPDKLFEVFAEVARPEQEGADPFILQKYPPDYDEQDVLNNIPKFAFPCKVNTSQVDQFAFVLTDLESLYRFGYCRHGTGAQTCLCIVSDLPWYEVFYKMLNFLAEIINRSENSDLVPFLKAAYEQSIPVADEPVTIVAAQDMFNFTAPDSTCLPSIPASRNLTEYYNAIDTNNMMKIFASMLHERRIIVTSKKLSRVTACIHASEALLYPMHWQHLYIPVLPAHLIDYVTAPMPYLIGVHSSLMEKIEKSRMEIGDAVIIEADKNEVRSEYDDLEALPEDVSSYLKRHLKTQRVQTSMMDTGDAISTAFLQALVRLIGGYRDALKIRDGEPITFDRDAFVQTRSSQSMQVFLENMLQLQIFQQFINGRLELLNEGGGLTELFEQESVKYADSLNTQSKYKEWLARVNKQKRKIKAGGKDIISDMKEKAGPMMNTAVQSMKVHGKKVMSKVREMNENKMSSRKVTGGVVHSRITSSDRQRPSTIAGSRLATSRPPRPPPPAVSSSQHPRPSTTITSPDRSTGYRSQLSVEEDGRGIHDDSHLRLSYHSVDVSLMTDTDIQKAMMRSASAEHLPPKHQSVSPQSTSDGDISSTPSSEALSPSDENLTDIPYLDMATTSSHATPQAPTSSSEEDVTRPPPLPSKDSKPPADRLIISDRLKTPEPVRSAPVAPPRPARRAAESRAAGSSPQPSPQLVRPPSHRPHRTSSEKVGVGHGEVTQVPAAPKRQATEKSLIQFESSESEADGVEQFDPLGAAGSGDGDDVSPPGSSQSLTRSRSSRNSLMRSAAFRRAPANTPIRRGFREDASPVGERGSTEVLTDLFDPLVSVSSSPSIPITRPADHNHDTPPHTDRKVVEGGSTSLMHDWTLDHLAAGSSLSRVPSASTALSSPSQATSGFSGVPSATSGFSGVSCTSGFSRVPSGGVLTCPVTAAISSPRPVLPMATMGSPMATMSSNPLYVPPSSLVHQRHSATATPLSSAVRSNPLYQPLRSSHPPAKPFNMPGTQSTGPTASTDPFHGLDPLGVGSSPKPSPGSKSVAPSSITLSPGRPQTFGIRCQLTSPSPPPPTLTQPRPPPRPPQTWETFD